MAIQNRRGAYVDFDKSKMVAGEIAVVQSGDPEATDGRGVYVSFQNGTAKRLAAHDELETYIDQQLSTIKDAIMADIRVISQESDSDNQLQAGDYVMVDSTSEGTRKFDLGTALTGIKEDLDEIASGGSGLTAAMKQAILQIASKVAYIDDQGQTYYDDLYDALYAITAIRLNTNSIQLTSIGATSQLTATTVPEGGAVTWSSSDTSVAMVDQTGLVTSVAYGSATITATAGSVSATCSVLIAAKTCTGISATYTQPGVVYGGASLDSLKTDLVVTASWSDSTTTTLASTDYMLSGALEEGTSVITVSYAGQTDTFDVTVSVDTTYIETILATLMVDTDFTLYDNTLLSESTGETSEDTRYKISEFITIPDGTTSFSVNLSKRANAIIVWYDSEQAYIGSGNGGNTYSSNGAYGEMYTDTNNDNWSAVPANAKYCRICNRSDVTYEYVKFKHNAKLDESVTPVAGIVYYYTYTGSSQAANTDDYLPCSGMAYAHARPIHRRGATFYDAEKIAVQTVSSTNNYGNNIAIPNDAVYFRIGNVTCASTSSTGLPTRNGIGLIEFTDTELTSW